MRKRRGPRMEPCGTPQVILRFPEKVDLYLTRCFLSVKYDLNQRLEIPRMP